jgi:hypothetical protein
MGDSYSWWMQDRDELERCRRWATVAAWIGFAVGLIVGFVIGFKL